MNHYYIYRKNSYIIEHVIHAEDKQELDRKWHRMEKKKVFSKETHDVSEIPAFAHFH